MTVWSKSYLARSLQLYKQQTIKEVKLMNNFQYKTMYSVEAEETSDGFNLSIELPGFKKEEITVEQDNKDVRVKAKKDKKSYGERFLLSRVPESIEATLEDGILKLVGKWKESEKAKKIEIKAPS